MVALVAVLMPLAIAAGSDRPPAPQDWPTPVLPSPPAAFTEAELDALLMEAINTPMRL